VKIGGANAGGSESAWTRRVGTVCARVVVDSPVGQGGLISAT